MRMSSLPRIILIILGSIFLTASVLHSQNRADYICEGTSVDILNPTPGATITVSGNITNLGRKTNAQSQVGYYLSTSPNWDSSMSPIASTTIPKLNSGASAPHSVSFAISQSTQTGIYYIIVRADDLNGINEGGANENNNTQSVEINVIPLETCDDNILNQNEEYIDCGGVCAPCSDIDLLFTAYSVGDTAIAQGQISFSYNVKNVGTGTSGPSHLGLFLSRDTILSINDDIPVFERFYSSIGAGNGVNSALTIPNDAGEGDFYFLFVVDYLKEVDEYREYNNLEYEPVYLLPPSCADGLQNQNETGVDCGGECDICLSDLTISKFTTSASAIAGGDLALNFTVKNIGFADSGPNTAGLFLSTDDQLDTLIDQRFFSRDFSNIIGGSGYNTTILAPNVSAGNYFLILSADYNNQVNESDELNNIAVNAIELTVSCTDSVQNGIENGLDCGGVCPVCVEICDDSIDNDNDGLIDCSDFDCSNIGTCPCTHPDYDALMDFYAATGGSTGSWVNPSITGWDDPCTVCSWYGVTCDENDRVTNLVFGLGDGLVGGLPSNLGDLTFLKSLSISGADFRSNPSIPPSITKLVNLEQLTISRCAMTSPLSPYLLELPQLKSINFSYGGFNESDWPVILQLNQLERINFHNCDFKGELPDELGQFSNFLQLDFSFNDLSGCIPQSFTNLCGLNVNLFGNDCLSHNGGNFASFCADDPCIPSSDPACSSCSDGIQNGDETGVDCGGSCLSCSEIDLIADNVTVRDEIVSGYAGDPLKFIIAYSVLNRAISSGESPRLGFYLSQDTIWDEGDMLFGDLLMIWKAIGSHGSGFNNIFTLPSNAPIGNSYILMKVDYELAVTEIKEYNNVVYTPFEILESTCFDNIQNGPETGVDCGGECDPCLSTDYIAHELRVRNGVTSAFRGDPIEFGIDYEVINEDVISSEIPRVGFYVSRDIVFDSTDLYMGNIALNRNINYYSFEYLNDFRIPANAYFDDVYLIMKLDYEEVIDELLEENNYAFTPFFISGSTCSDGLQNGDETGIDCGGSCAPCTEICDNGADDDGDGLIDCDDTDCALDTACGSCTDGILNQDETYVDCGGVCAPCNCTHPDQAALMAIYDATGGDAWTQKSGWSAADCDVCSWSGVTCDDMGRVSSLTLSNNNLNGSLPLGISELNHLTSLIITDNPNLVGEIPYTLASLTSLEILALSGNALTGSIPPSLGDLSLLRALSLNDNMLSGTIPPSLGSLSNLVELKLNNNAIEGTIPDELGGLTQLVRMYLSENNLSGCIPSSFMSYCGNALIVLNCNPCLAYNQGVGFGSFCAGDSCVPSNLPECAGNEAQNELQAESRNIEALENPITDLVIYPNPVTNLLIIESPPDIRSGSVTLTDMSGRTMMTAELNPSYHSLDMSNYELGTYILLIQVDEQVISNKIVKLD